MPTYNIPVKYETAEAPRMLAALKHRYGVQTDQQALDGLTNYVLQHLVDVTSKYERETAIAQATQQAIEKLPPPITVTKG